MELGNIRAALEEGGLISVVVEVTVAGSAVVVTKQKVKHDKR